MHKVYSICSGAAVRKEWGDVVWSRVRETELVYWYHLSWVYFPTGDNTVLSQYHKFIDIIINEFSQNKAYSNDTYKALFN